MIIYYLINKTYYRTYNGKVMGSSISVPQGEETIKKVSFKKFDEMIEKGEVYF